MRISCHHPFEFCFEVWIGKALKDLSNRVDRVRSSQTVQDSVLVRSVNTSTVTMSRAQLRAIMKVYSNRTGAGLISRIKDTVSAGVEKIGTNKKTWTHGVHSVSEAKITGVGLCGHRRAPK